MTPGSHFQSTIRSRIAISGDTHFKHVLILALG